MTPTVAAAGTTTNTVPAQAELFIDVRAATVAEQHRVHEALLALRPTPAGQLMDRAGRTEPAADGAELRRGPVRARRGAGAARLGLAGLTQTSVGGGSDGNFTAGIGVPTLDGLGAVGGGAHADDEHVLVDSLVPRTALLAALVADLLPDPAGPTRAAVRPVSGPVRS